MLLEHLVKNRSKRMNCQPAPRSTSFSTSGIRKHIILLILELQNFFLSRLPEEIEKIQLDEDGILREIDITIRNIHGIRVGLFSPQMAFEKFAEKQISKLKQPIKTCINLVIEELSAAVRTCTQKVSNSHCVFKD